MIKNYLLLGALCLFSTVNSQIISFTDSNFKAKLLQADVTNYIAKDINYQNIKIDSDGNGEIEKSEAEQVYYLDVHASEITSLDEIKEFKNLIDLSCSNNYLSNLDLRGLTKLERLDCYRNNITDINIENLSNITSFSCPMNELVDLDLHNLTNLEFLHCNTNELINLNISGLSEITDLDFSSNNISNLDISSLVNLQYLNCIGNQITSLDLEGLNKLETLFCGSNQLSNLKLANLPKLRFLACWSNLFTTLDVSSLSKLETLSFGNNALTSIDVTNLNNLTSITLVGSSLSKIDVSNCHSLDSFFAYDNPLLESIFMKNGSIENEVEIDGNPNLKYVCVDEEQISSIKTVVELGNQPECNVGSYCSFDSGAENYTITGKQRLDVDNNGCDASDPGFAIKFNITDGLVDGTVIDQRENYDIKLPAGHYTVTPVVENPNYFSVSPTFLEVDFPNVASPFTQDFCVAPIGTHNDLEITLLPIDAARPGFDANYKIIYKNKGNTPQTGSVNLIFDDSVLDIVSSAPLASNNLNNLTWNFTDLKPSEVKEIKLKFKVNSPVETPSVNIDDILKYKVSINSASIDETPVDNTFEFNQTVVGSYDPNDKTCLEGNVIKPELIGEYVHYMIRFENTGTYPAENIVVKDMIDLSKFDISTLMPTSASHSYTTKISGNKVEFIFEKINLPYDDANNDGYIAFKIKTLPSLVAGDSFENEANIYFDYNFPILTNKATSTFKTILGTQDLEFSNYFSVYPIPAKDILNIASKKDIEVESISIYNILGQLVIAIPNAKPVSSIDVSNLKAGNYILNIKTEKGTSGIKFVKI